jgi:hypothetical protein
MECDIVEQNWVWAHSDKTLQSVSSWEGWAGRGTGFHDINDISDISDITVQTQSRAPPSRRDRSEPFKSCGGRTCNRLTCSRSIRKGFTSLRFFIFILDRGLDHEIAFVWPNALPQKYARSGVCFGIRRILGLSRESNPHQVCPLQQKTKTQALAIALQNSGREVFRNGKVLFFGVGLISRALPQDSEVSRNDQSPIR